LAGREASGETALHEAAEGGHADVVEALLTAGGKLSFLSRDTFMRLRIFYFILIFKFALTEQERTLR
jgi:ankyrin repeat protein